MKDKRLGNLRRGVVVQQDNAPVHSSYIAVDAVKECGFEVLLNVPYSPDLVPSYYHLLLKTLSAWKKTQRL